MRASVASIFTFSAATEMQGEKENEQRDKRKWGNTDWHGSSTKRRTANRLRSLYNKRIVRFKRERDSLLWYLPAVTKPELSRKNGSKLFVRESCICICIMYMNMYMYEQRTISFPHRCTSNVGSISGFCNANGFSVYFRNGPNLFAKRNLTRTENGKTVKEWWTWYSRL